MRFRILNLALREARKSNIHSKGMGCVIYRGNKVISKGYNQVYDRNSEKPKGLATMHAEMSSIEDLARKLNLIKDLRKLLVSSRVYTQSSVIPRLKPECRKER